MDQTKQERVTQGPCAMSGSNQGCAPFHFEPKVLKESCASGGKVGGHVKTGVSRRPWCPSLLRLGVRRRPESPAVLPATRMFLYCAGDPP